MKNKIEVYKSNLLTEVIATFNKIEDLLKYNKKHNISATQIVINDCVLYGWDELYYFLK